jgi:hypothetical protein
VAAMEDVLDVYARPRDPARPLVCFDEGGKELRGLSRPSIPLGPGHPLQQDTEYTRHGSANLFLAVAPHLGWRAVAVTAHHRRDAFARALRDLADLAFPAAERIVLVLDNLNTHTAGALYATFPPAEARRIWRRFEVHYTPKHGSWLNMAELELSVAQRQCLDRRIASRAALGAALAAWAERRNAAAVPIRWSFTIDDARTRLPHVYPAVEPDTID